MLQRALDHVLAIPWLELTPKGAIFLVEGGALALKAHKGMPEALLKSCATVGPNQCLCGRAMATGEFIFAGHLDGRHETTYEGIMPHGHYCVPIASGGEVKGVMCLYLKEGHEVRPGERELLEAAASVLAGIIQRKRAEEALRKSEEKFRKAFDSGSLGFHQHQSPPRRGVRLRQPGLHPNHGIYRGRGDRAHVHGARHLGQARRSHENARAFEAGTARSRILRHGSAPRTGTSNRA